MPHRIATVFVLVFLSALELRADPDAATLERCKRATALVDIGRRGSGTAFCVHSSGLFVTNAHVAEQSTLPGGTMTLILSPGEKDERKLSASAIAINRELDLAIVRVAERPAEPLPTVDVGDASGLIETTSVTAFGYPFGRMLAEKGAYPTISVSTGRVTSLRKSKGELQRIQLDASLNPGNSGGPVVNDKGAVVGIVVSGIPDSGIKFAIPINHLLPELARPIMLYLPTPVPLAGQNQKVEFKFGVLNLKGPRDRFDVGFMIEDGREQVRTFKPETTDGEHYTVSATPIPIDGTTINVTVTYHNGSITGTTTDRIVKVDDEQFKLSQIARYDPESPMPIRLHAGEKRTGPVSGLEDVPLVVGNLDLKVDLSKAVMVSFPPAEPRPQPKFHITVKEKGQIISQTVGPIAFTGQPPTKPTTAPAESIKPASWRR
jgi:hypothetical protein